MGRGGWGGVRGGELKRAPAAVILLCCFVPGEEIAERSRPCEEVRGHRVGACQGSGERLVINETGP